MPKDTAHSRWNAIYKPARAAYDAAREAAGGDVDAIAAARKAYRDATTGPRRQLHIEAKAAADAQADLAGR